MNALTPHPLLSARAGAFIAGKHQLLIGGSWRDAASGETIDIEDPCTGQVIAKVAAGARADVDLAVAAARQALDGPWGKMSGLERGKLISRFATRLEELAGELAEIEAIDCGKPVTYARYVDVGLSANTYHYMAGWASKITGETVDVSSPGEFHAFTTREPVGVVAQVVPWNFPLVLTAYKLAPSLAAGCTAIIKPAELTPLSTLRLAQIAEEVGFPPGVINVITGYGATAGAALAEHPGIDKIAFTGSTDVGKAVARAATGNLKRVTLELGGKAPMMVFRDADLEKTIPALAGAIFFHQGQVCTAGTRLFIHKSIHDRVVEGIAAEAKKLVIGHGLEQATTMGPMISGRQRDRVLAYIEQGRKSGAEFVCGGNSLGENGYFLEPTVLAGTDSSMSVVREEIFGPVLCTMAFGDDDIETLADKANETEFGLSASIWTRDLSTAHKMAKRIKAGSIWINMHNFFDPALPFGGYKQSGWGREQGAEAIRTFTEVKSVCAAL